MHRDSSTVRGQTQRHFYSANMLLSFFNFQYRNCYLSFSLQANIVGNANVVTEQMTSGGHCTAQRTIN